MFSAVRRPISTTRHVADSSAVLIGLLVAVCWQSAGSHTARAVSLVDVIQAVQPKIVKIYGAGGLRGLEAYQSGFLISSEGHILTAWSYVLDTDYISVTLNDGHKFQAELLGADPRLEIAVLKIDAEDLPYFHLDEAVDIGLGGRILAFSNLFGVATGNEPASVLHGSIAARTKLAARRGVYKTPYRGPVYVLDAMTNNPGAAGGALTDVRGRMVGLLGKELRNSMTNTWLNYAIPIDQLASSVNDIRAGKNLSRQEGGNAKKPLEPLKLSLLGIVLVPDVLEKTPPFIDHVRSGSPAATVGLKADDLVLYVNNQIVQSCKAFSEQLSFIDRDDAVKITVLRNEELIQLELSSSE